MSRRDALSIAAVLCAVASCPAAQNPSPAPPPPAPVSSAKGSDIPDFPSSKAVAIAIEQPRDDARGCIGPANGPYRTKIVWDYTGQVQSVAVTGSPSAAEEDCIRKAFATVNLGPFRRAKFTFATTISAR